jgi:hypothetical protein
MDFFDAKNAGVQISQDGTPTFGSEIEGQISFDGVVVRHGMRRSSNCLAVRSF